MDIETHERRAVPRLALSGQTTVRTQVGVAVRLLDLSLHGVRIAHRGLLRAGSPCALDLPAALGGRVPGQSCGAPSRAWSRRPTGSGPSGPTAGSGCRSPLAAEQQAVFGRALRDLTEWTSASYTPPHEHYGGAMTEARERRAVPRTTLAERPAARVRGMREVRLLDLSLTGAQIEHLDLVRPRRILRPRLPAPVRGADPPRPGGLVHRDRAAAQARGRGAPRGPERPPVHHAHRGAARGPRRHPAAPRGHVPSHR